MAAGVNLRDSTADRTLTEIRVRDVGGTDRVIVQGRVIGPDGQDRVFWDPAGVVSFSVNASPSFVSGITFGTGVATTSSTTANATGGTAPYHYAWTLVSYDHPTTPPGALSASSATTAFRQSNIGIGTDYSATFRVTATDSATPPNTATTTVLATFSDAS